MESKYVKIATLKLVLPKRRIIKLPGMSLISPPYGYLALFTEIHRTIPLALLTVDETRRSSIDKTAVLTSRETTLAIDTSKTYKLNAGTYGVCMHRCSFSFGCASNEWTDRVLYPEGRLTRIALEAAQGDAVFSLNDRIGLVHDTMALAKSGYATVSSALTVVDIFRSETECQCFCFRSMLFH